MKILFTLLLSISFTWAKLPEWRVDRDHSYIGFDVSYLSLGTVRGRFDKFAGKIVFDPNNLKDKKQVSRFKFSAIIAADSIHTGVLKRDLHLKSPDFFNTAIAAHKKIIFTSNEVKTHNGKRFEIIGNLKANNVSKKMKVVLNYKGMASAYNIDRIFFKGKLKVNREEFGLAWNDGKYTATSARGTKTEKQGAYGKFVFIDLEIQAMRTSDLPEKSK